MGDKMNFQREWRAFSLAASLAITIGLVFPGVAALAKDPDLTIGGGPSGGVFNVVATALGDNLRQQFKDSLIDVQPGGSGPNLIRVSTGKADLGVTSANNAWDAWYGKDPATPDKPIRNVRGLMTFFPSAIQIWVDANSKLNTINDLKGKQMSAGQPGQTSWLAFENLLKVYGLSIADIESGGGKLHKLSWQESQNGLRNGQLDAVMWVSLFPHTTVLENETVRPMRTLSFEEAKLDEYLKKYGGGFEKLTLPAGLYKGQTSPALTVGTSTFLFASDKMSDDVAYRIVKSVWDNLPRFQRSHSLLSYMTASTIGQGMVIPIHPGAKRFYDEKSIKYGVSELK